jgi:hypothetical protein
MEPDMRNNASTIRKTSWKTLKSATATKFHSTMRIQLYEQLPPLPKQYAGSFRVTAGLPTATLYDSAGMDQFRAHVAFEACLKLARLEGYSVSTDYPCI